MKRNEINVIFILINTLMLYNDDYAAAASIINFN